MVLVEEGPWQEDEIETNLRRIQDRLYGCLDAALDGKLAELYPESAGKPILIRIDAYNVPQIELREFFDSFSGNVLRIPDYSSSLANSSVVSNISFDLNVE